MTINQKIENIVSRYWENEISKDNMVSQFVNILDSHDLTPIGLFESVINDQNADILEFLMTIGYALEDDDQFIDFIHQIISEPWHRSYEEMAHFLQSKKKPESVEPLRKAMQKRYEYLESYGTGTRQFINQCGHFVEYWN